MFAVRFCAVASLVAAAPLAAAPFGTAAEPFSPSGAQFSFAPPASQPMSFTFSAANTPVLGRTSLMTAQPAGSTLLPAPSPKLAGLPSSYLPTGMYGSGTSTLFSASPRSLLTSPTATPVQPSWQSPITPNPALGGASPWRATHPTSISPFAQPTYFGSYGTSSR